MIGCGKLIQLASTLIMLLQVEDELESVGSLAYLKIQLFENLLFVLGSFYS